MSLSYKPLSSGFYVLLYVRDVSLFLKMCYSKHVGNFHSLQRELNKQTCLHTNASVMQIFAPLCKRISNIAVLKTFSCSEEICSYFTVSKCREF